MPPALRTRGSASRSRSPQAASCSAVQARSARRISGRLRSWRPRCSCSLHRRRHQPGRLAAGAAGALLGRGAGDPGECQALESGRRIGARLLHPTGVDDAGDAVDGDRGLGDVGGQHDLAPRPRTQDQILLARGKIAVELDDREVALAGEGCEGLRGAPDLGRAGQEDQQVARGRLQPLANAARDER